MNPIRIGLMGFGRVGRQIYGLTIDDDRFEVAAISDIGQPHILHHLLGKTLGGDRGIELQGKYLTCRDKRTRLMPADRPDEIPWDIFGIDMVVDATGRFRSREELLPHLGNGAPRVITSALPDGDIDRVVLYGVNDEEARAQDRVISAGSASTTATALLLDTLHDAWGVEQASMTSVHAYTSDQSLQDYAGPDIRRSRSGAENIIPNTTPAREWVQRAIPGLQGRLSAYALNVPVQVGSMLDVTVILQADDLTADAVNDAFAQRAAERPRLLQVTHDPIVSSDVKGTPQSLLMDLAGTLHVGGSMFKLLAWHETLGHAQRILDVAGLYAGLDLQHTREAS